MSVNAPKHELIQLIYRHLKEHGFHSAAEELQIHSPQGKTNVSMSLLDIYSSWLNDSKRKKESDPTKPSKFKEQRTPSHKASKKQSTHNQTHTEGGCDSQGQELSQSLLAQTPIVPINSSAPRTPIKPMSRSPGKPVGQCPYLPAAPGDFSDTTGISEEKAKPTPLRQQESDNDAADQNKTGSAKKHRAVKDQTPKKRTVVVTTSPTGKAKKKVDNNAKKERHQKKSVPVKRKKTGENPTVAKKSKIFVKAEAAERDSSDSDSSLDVEKWKKLVLNMTETDVAKMDAINALDCSAPKPKKKRENKPLTTTPAKTDVQPPQSDNTSDEKGTVLGGDVTQTPAKNGKAKKNRNRTEQNRKTASLTSSDVMNSTIDTIEVTPSPSIPSLKESLEKENVNVAAPSEVKINQKSAKKKKKKINEVISGENSKDTHKHGIHSKDENNKMYINGNKKDNKGNVDGKELIGNVEITELIVQQKKLKKKKKNKNENILEQKTEGEINSEKTAEEENSGQSKKAKKKKKKEIDAGSPEKIIRAEEMQMGEPETEDKAGEENSEQISNEKKIKGKKRKNREGDTEPIENSKMFKEQMDEESLTSPSNDKEENHERTSKLNHKNKKGSSMKNDSLVLTPLLLSHETLSLSSEKKKKKKSTEVEDYSASL